MKPMVVTEDLRYTYEDGTEALRGITVKIKRGEKVAVMGANGSGKSTFFHHLNGLLKPTAGRVLIEGEPVDYSRKGLLKVRKKVGFVFQNPDDQLFSASVRQEISFGALNLGLSEEEAVRRVEGIMEALNITPFAHKPVHLLSGGQKKQVAIADILVMEPELIILDEPTAALDSRHTRIIDGIVDSLRDRGITVLLSTHSSERALLWADRIIVFDRGLVAAEGAPEEIFSDHELLKRANLEKPAVLRIFEILEREGVLKEGLKRPRGVDELEAYIKERNR
ncbi:MAG TPA: ATP-binding cassette domain-containing protein [Candidatus Copromorpha excrementigallinarum]|uniref:ABC transporter ATP-binding protein n=1 Tax=Candidatus Allocopromorpha excrementigallinarum TaxID=2840742 RepID=A0A9D1L5Q8_9FIRM|nr:ATP-binding cassette domain-containing protein [Candidatus Copromorpha excrementigallinarum]